MKYLEAIEILGLAVNVVAIIVCPIIAHNKGRSAVGWFFGGLFLSGIGIIIVACLSNKNVSIPRFNNASSYGYNSNNSSGGTSYLPISNGAEQTAKDYIQHNNFVRSAFSGKMGQKQILAIKATYCSPDTSQDQLSYLFTVRGKVSALGEDERYFRAIVTVNKSSGFCGLQSFSIS